MGAVILFFTVIFMLILAVQRLSVCVADTARRMQNDDAQATMDSTATTKQNAHNVKAGIYGDKRRLIGLDGFLDRDVCCAFKRNMGTGSKELDAAILYTPPTHLCADEAIFSSVIYKSLLLCSPAGICTKQYKKHCVNMLRYQQKDGSLPEFLPAADAEEFSAGLAGETVSAAALAFTVSGYINYSGDIGFLHSCIEGVKNDGHTVYMQCIDALNYCKGQLNAYGLITAQRGGLFDYILQADTFSDVFAGLYYIAALQLFLPFIQEQKNGSCALKIIAGIKQNITAKLNIWKDVSPQLQALLGTVRLYCQNNDVIGSTYSGDDGIEQQQVAYKIAEQVINCGSGADMLFCGAALASMGCMAAADEIVKVVTDATMPMWLLPLRTALIAYCRLGIRFKAGRLRTDTLRPAQCGGFWIDFADCRVSVNVGKCCSIVADGITLGLNSFFSLPKGCKSAKITV